MSDAIQAAALLAKEAAEMAKAIIVRFIIIFLLAVCCGSVRQCSIRTGHTIYKPLQAYSIRTRGLQLSADGSQLTLRIRCLPSILITADLQFCKKKEPARCGF